MNTGVNPLDWIIFEDTTAMPVVISTGIPERLGAPTGTEYSKRALSMLEDPSVDVVLDGGFEAGSPNPFWTEFSTNFGTPLCTVALCGTGTGTGPHAGEWWAWFGGIAAYENATMSQSVTIGNSGAASLSFWVEQFVCSGDASDYLEVNIDGNQVWVTDATDPACGVLGYRQVTIDVSAYADGGAHTLEFNSEVFGTGNTNFFVDDVVLDDGSAVVCSVPSDIPWVSADPVSGTVAGGSSVAVNVTFDSTGLAVGTYSGNLCVTSNDPDEPLVVVPVELEVTPYTLYLPIAVREP
jgi:hypothetical protein